VGGQKGGGRVGGFHQQDGLGEEKNNMYGDDSDDVQRKTRRTWLLSHFY